MIRVYSSSRRCLKDAVGAETAECPDGGAACPDATVCEREKPAGSTSETIAPHRAAPRQFIEAVYRFSKNLCGHPRPGGASWVAPIRAFSCWVSHGKGPINEP